MVRGSIPEWMELGPPIVIDGLEAHEVLGDWSHLNECDRPPKYVAHGWEAPILPPELRRDEDRPPLTQRLPGKDIGDLKGRHSGAVAILFNGPSLAKHDVSKITLPVIGMNRTHKGNPEYHGPDPDYLCIIDNVWFKVPEVREHPGLINGSVHTAPYGYRATRSMRGAPFSMDLAFDGYVCPAPCTTGHLALQAAVYMGFKDLYCFGFDMAGAHFDGSPGISQHFHWAVNYHSRQKEVLKEHGINVYLVGSPDSEAPFEHCSFEQFLEAQ